MSNQQSEKQSFPNSWWLSQSCDSCEATSGPKLWSLRSCLCCRDLGSIANIDSLEEHLWHVASILASGKTRMAPTPSKTTTAWWLVSNLTDVPLCMKCESQIFPNTNLDRLGKTGPYLQLRSFTLFALHYLYSGPFWTRWLSQSCGSYAAAFAVEMWAQMDRIKHSLEEHLWHVASILASGKTRMAPKTNKTTTAWWLASNSKTMPVAMKCQINNQLKPDVPQHKPAWSLLGTILDPASWWLSQSCDSCEAISGPKLWFLGSCLCCRDLGSIAKKDSLEEHLWHVASILASGKTRMAPKTNKSNTAWWLVSNLTDVPLCMKCQSQIFPNTNLDRLGKTGPYLQLRSFTLFALHYLYSGPFWTRWLSQSCGSYAAAFAVEMWDDVGPNGPNQTQLGRTLVARCQHPCEWQD